MHRLADIPICSPIWCVDSSKTAPILLSCRSQRIPRCRSKIFCGGPRAQSETPARRNSRGIEFGDRASLETLLREIHGVPHTADAKSIVDGIEIAGRERPA